MSWGTSCYYYRSASRLDSQRPRSRTDVKINSNVAVRPNTLPAGDGSRSVPASQIRPFGGSNRMRPNELVLMVLSFEALWLYGVANILP